ncbi:MFS transporter [Anaerovorax odorimutans]|uniref:MFS transporter n=1 Tax=Anaerovorax odorimutans TaxID=109327 RepID=A0ABT1RKS2_9FIRM|nr:MFS transporter [Anaerovorax odorimutans]MCQ4635782.1 MFS transporter [Anaerovorax odorimutans]
MKSITFKQNGRFYHGWWIVLAGFLLMTFAYVGLLSVTSIFVIPVTTDLQVQRADFVLYSTLMCLVSVVLSAYAGKFMGKGNIKWIMAINSILGALLYFGFSQSSHMWQFYLFGLLLGIPYTCLTNLPISILINNWFGGKIKGTAMGLAFLGSGIGGMILTPALNAVITAYDWRVGYMALAGIFLVILTPAILLTVVKTPEEKGFTRMGETAEEQQSGTLSGMTLAEAKKTPMLWMVCAAVVLAVFASSGILANSVSFFIECGFSSAKAASLAGIMLGSLIIGKPIVGAVCDRFGISKGAFLSFATFALGFLLLYFMAGASMLVVPFIACYAFGCASITICPPLLINGLFGEKDYGTIVGVLNMATNIGGAFGGMIAAKVYDITNSYAIFWMICAIGVAAACVLCVASFAIKNKKDLVKA